MSYDHSFVRELLLPPLQLPGRQVDRDQRVAQRGSEPGPERRVVRRRRRRRCRSRACSSSGRRSSASRRRRRRRARAALAPLGVGRRDRPERVRPGGREIGRVVGHHEAAHAVLGAGRADDQAVVRRRSARSSRSSRSSRRRPERRARSARAPSCLPVAGSSATIVMSSVSRKTRSSQYGDAAVRDDAEVLERGDVVGRVVPEQVAGRRVDGEDLIVARGDVHRPVDDDRVGLLALLDPGHDLVQVERERAPELIDVAGRDLRQRRVADSGRRCCRSSPSSWSGPPTASRCEPRRRCRRAGRAGSRTGMLQLPLICRRFICPPHPVWFCLTAWCCRPRRGVAGARANARLTGRS